MPIMSLIFAPSPPMTAQYAFSPQPFHPAIVVVLPTATPSLTYVASSGMVVPPTPYLTELQKNRGSLVQLPFASRWQVICLNHPSGQVPCPDEAGSGGGRFTPR